MRSQAWLNHIPQCAAFACCYLSFCVPRKSERRINSIRILCSVSLTKMTYIFPESIFWFLSKFSSSFLPLFPSETLRQTQAQAMTIEKEWRLLQLLRSKIFIALFSSFIYFMWMKASVSSVLSCYFSLVCLLLPLFPKGFKWAYSDFTQLISLYCA